MTVDVEALKRVPVFSTLGEREAKAVASLFKERTFTRGEVIAEEGKHGIGFFVITSGTAQVTVRGEEVAMLGPGDHFGEIALIDDGPRTATVTADTDLTCYVLIAWDFRPLVKAEPTIAWSLLEGLARMLRSMQERADTAV